MISVIILELVGRGGTTCAQSLSYHESEFKHLGQQQAQGESLQILVSLFILRSEDCLNAASSLQRDIVFFSCVCDFFYYYSFTKINEMLRSSVIVEKKRGADSQTY